MTVYRYVGELRPSFGQVVDVLRPGGHFAFTVEAVGLGGSSTGHEIDESFESNAKGFQLLQSGRFGFSRTYVDNVVDSTEGMELVMSREFSPRMDAGKPVPGYLYIVRREEGVDRV